MNNPPRIDENAPTTVEELEDHLSEPGERLVELFSRLDGDLVFLGVAGKMGPTMARMARRAAHAAGTPRRIFGVSRFSSPETRERLERWGIETVACDLLDENQVRRLPDAPLVVSMSGFKFGADRDPALAWATNCHVPALVCRRYDHSRIVAFSTGNVYGTTRSDGTGSRETDPLVPDGVYAATAMGREGIYQFFSRTLELPTTLLRLNYATELRYGVLVDLAESVRDARPIDLAVSHTNVIWQRDANELSLMALATAETPARIVNLAGGEILRVRDIVEELARWMHTTARFTGQEGERALLSDGRLGHALLGTPRMAARQMIRWTADWVARRAPTLGKPTHFQTTTGNY